MSRHRLFLLSLTVLLWLAIPVHASTTGSLSAVIDRFVAEQFPRAASHFWVVNGTQWQDEDEVVVDVNATAFDRQAEAPIEQRYLLLIVRGELAGSQNIPLGAKTDCEPEMM